jgi:hypothetical protein
VSAMVAEMVKKNPSLQPAYESMQRQIRKANEDKLAPNYQKPESLDVKDLEKLLKRAEDSRKISVYG